MTKCDRCGRDGPELMRSGHGEPCIAGKLISKDRVVELAEAFEKSAKARPYDDDPVGCTHCALYPSSWRDAATALRAYAESLCPQT